jgi:hypothetical protein
MTHCATDRVHVQPDLLQRKTGGGVRGLRAEASAEAPTPRCACAACRPSADEKVALCLSFAQECIEEAELRSLFTSGKPSIVAYDGFEPSGRMHIAQARRTSLAGTPLLRRWRPGGANTMASIPRTWVLCQVLPRWDMRCVGGLQSTSYTEALRRGRAS